MGGSIRIPASFCGIVGLKPTHGVVARGPCFEEARTLNTIGPMARSVRDIALCLDIIAGPDPADNLSVATGQARYRDAAASATVAGLRVAWSPDLGDVDVDVSMRNAFARALGALDSSGWKLEHACPEVSGTATLHYDVAQGERGSFADGREALVEPRLRPLLAAAGAVSAKDYFRAQIARASYTRAWEEFFQRYDLLLTPAVQLAAFKADRPRLAQLNGRTIDVDSDNWWELSLPASLTGCPAISVPMGLSDDGLPLGLQIMGPRFADARCIAAAAAVEAVLSWPRLPQDSRTAPHTEQPL